MGQGGTLRLRFDAFELDEADARLKRDGVPVALAPKAFAVLCTLARSPGTLVTKNELLDAVWGHQHVSESVLKTIVSELRGALADDAKQPRYIETASRRGYRFIGLPAPSSAQPAAAAPVAVPDTSETSGTSSLSHRPLIGREQALDKLRDCWRRTLNGERQLVWIAGEAGIGKSRLISSFVEELPPETAVFGQCVEVFGTGEPYLPILEAIKELCRREPATVDAMRTAAPTWLVQMPWLISEAERASLHREVAGAHPDRMVREMRELMDRFTAQRPLLFILEDLHWSDHGTLRMMEHFARRPREVKLMWIASFRLTQVIAEDHPLRELRQELRLHRMCEEILLEPFSESEVGRYIESRVPHVTFSEPFVRRLHDHTDGLPLFVANVTDALIAQAAAEPDSVHTWLDAAATAPLPVPDSLTGVIEKQITRLPADIRSVLEAASVCGVEFSATMVAEMLERDSFWVSERCDELVRRQFWLQQSGIVELPGEDFDSRYTFLHALYRHVFYERLSMSQRVQLHRRAARILDRARAAGAVVPAAELAVHYERGHQVATAMRYYSEAARNALVHFAPREAIDLTSTALALLERCPDTQLRMELELGLIHVRGIACAQLLGVGAQETLAAFERTQTLCRILPQTPERTLQLNGLGLSRYIEGHYAQARAIGEEVLLRGTEHDDGALQVAGCLLLGMIDGVQARHETARRLFERGMAVAEEHAGRLPMAVFVIDPSVAIPATGALPLMHLGLFDQARVQIELARSRAEQMGQPTARMLSLWVAGMEGVRRHEPAKVLEIAKALHAVVDESMLTQGYGPARWLRGWAEAHLGSPLEGYRLIRQGYEGHAKLGMFAGNTETLAYAAEALILAGDWKGAEAQLDEAMQLAQRIQESVMLTNLLLLRARVAAGRNERTRARELMQEALAIAQNQSSPYFQLRALLALCESDDRTATDVQALRELLTSLREGLDMPLARQAAALVAQPAC